MWRVDLPHTEEAVASGTITYGEVPTLMTQAFLATARRRPRTSGQTVYLYILRTSPSPSTAASRLSRSSEPNALRVS